MKTWLLRLVIGLAFAVPAVLVTFALANAKDPAAPVRTEECSVCHPNSYDTWREGAHGQAVSDPAFNEAWVAQGSPERCLSCHTTGYNASTGEFVSEGVNCAACHGPVPDDHPDEPMPVNRAATACGNCHTETLFEWQVSQHRQNDLTCAACHDPHATGLKSETPSELCGACHRERAQNFNHTAHSEQGLDCAGCHLAPLEDPVEEGHAARDHSFNVRLSTCNECHSYQMHDPRTVHEQGAVPEATPTQSLASIEAMGVTLEPEPVSPVGFAVLAGVIGLGTGVVLTPWLERWYRRFINK